MARKHKTRRVRPCARCEEEAARLYRVSWTAEVEWALVCDACWPGLSQGNPHYRYGGTWTSRRRR